MQVYFKITSQFPYFLQYPIQENNEYHDNGVLQAIKRRGPLHESTSQDVMGWGEMETGQRSF